jgi:hypothetical protein
VPLGIRREEMTKRKDAAAVSLGRRGGKARARKVSKERLSEIGKAAAAKRWAKKGGN